MKHFLSLITLLVTLTAVSAVWADDLRMDKEALNGMLGAPDLVVLDVRSGTDWSSSKFKIKNAVRAAGADYATWSASYPKDKTLVLYCA